MLFVEIDLFAYTIIFTSSMLKSNVSQIHTFIFYIEMVKHRGRFWVAFLSICFIGCACDEVAQSEEEL